MVLPICAPISAKLWAKPTRLKKNHFAAFEAAYEAPDRTKVQDERWSVFTREEITAKGNSLDLGLIRDAACWITTTCPTRQKAQQKPPPSLKKR